MGMEIGANHSVNPWYGSKTNDGKNNSTIKVAVDPEGAKKIALALAGLATITAGVIAVKKGKAQEVLKKMKTKVDVNKVANEAAEKISKGENYTKVKEVATKNLQKADKKIIKGVIKKAHAAKADVEKARQVIQKNQVLTAKAAPAKIKSAAQGIKSMSIAEVESTASKAKEIASQAKTAAETMKKFAEDAPTHKNIRRATYAANKAIEAEVKAKKTAEKAGKIIEEKIQKEAARANAEALMKASPKWQASAGVRMQHAEQQAKNAIVREAKREMQKPGYQRALSKYANASKSKLESLLNSGKLNTSETHAVKDLLAKLA